MKKNLKLIIIIVIIIAAVAGYFLFFKKAEATSYIAVPVFKGSISQEVNATGEIGAVQLVTVGAQVSGQIETLYVELGQTVKKGDMIAQIDSTTQQNDYDTQKAKLSSYNAQLENAQVQLKITKSQYDREVKLYAQKATSKENLENAESTYATAKSTVAELESLIVQTQIAVNTAEVNLGYTKIVSPRDGTIVSVPVEEGQTVNAAMSTPTIVQIADLSLMEILMEISEGDVTKVAPGMAVTYTVLSETDLEFETVLKSIDPGLTTLTNGSYEQGSSSDEAVYYYGRLEVPNADGKLHIGMTTQNTIKIAHVENVLVVPYVAVQERDGRQFVSVLENGDKVVEKAITTGLSDNINIEVLSGINEGEQVVLFQMSANEINAAMGNMPKPPTMM